MMHILMTCKACSKHCATLVCPLHFRKNRGWKLYRLYYATQAYIMSSTQETRELTSLMMVDLSMAFNCAVREPFPLEMECIRLDTLCNDSVNLFRTRVFHCSSITSGGLGLVAYINAFSRQQLLINTFVIIGDNHFSFTFSNWPLISHSAKI